MRFFVDEEDWLYKKFCDKYNVDCVNSHTLKKLCSAVDSCKLMKKQTMTSTLVKITGLMYLKKSFKVVCENQKFIVIKLEKLN